MNKEINKKDFIALSKQFFEDPSGFVFKDIIFEIKKSKSICFEVNFLYNYIINLLNENKIIIAESFVYDIIYEFILNCPSSIDFQYINKSLSMICSHYIEKNNNFSYLSSLFFIKSLMIDFNKEYIDEVDLNINELYKESLKQLIYNTHAISILCEKTRKFICDNFNDLIALIEISRDNLFSYMSIFTLKKRFLLKDHNGITYELPQVYWLRVSIGLCLNNLCIDDIKKCYSLLSELKYLPSTPTLCHSGFQTAQLTSCYLSVVGDDLSEIFQSYGDSAQLAKWSGGIATSWSQIRGCGAYIKKINMNSQGLIPYLKIEDDIISSISKTGTRRGGKAVYVEPWHYDIDDFLDLKKNTGDHRRRTHDLNTALWIPDLFMKRVVDGDCWTLFSPDETPDLHENYGQSFNHLYLQYEDKAAKGEIKLYKKVSAIELWKKILTRIFETGHPWLTFKDSCNIRSPQRHCGVIHSSNLCTEITLNTSKNEIAVCNLGSINLAAHIDSDGNIDFGSLKETVKLAVKILDGVIDLTYYPVIQTKNSNMLHRPIGLGVMGWQDVLFAKKLSFEDEVVIDIMNQVSEFISYYGIESSIELAELRGSYASYDGSLWSQGVFPHEAVSLLEQESQRVLSFQKSKPILNWKRLREKLLTFGIRNSNIFAIAPTATISTLAGCFPSIEPIYKNMYVKSNLSGEFSIINKYLQADLEYLGLWNDAIIEKIKLADGSVQNISEIPFSIKKIYKTAFEIDQKKLLYLTAMRSQWIDQSQSHNIFFSSTSGKLLDEIYFYAWNLGLKTTYYLRTLAKSQIEKSTSQNNKELTQLRQNNDKCNINNEECESCQ